MIERLARRALGLELRAHPHMLRHAFGYALAAEGRDTRAIQQYLEHRSITSTVGVHRHGTEPVQGFLVGVSVIA
jgi:site-specific recombinase XerD